MRSKSLKKDVYKRQMLICEMAAYLRSIGSSIKQRLEEIYQQYGRYLNQVDSFEFPGLSGMDKMAAIMEGLRENPPQEFAGRKVCLLYTSQYCFAEDSRCREA